MMYLSDKSGNINCSKLLNTVAVKKVVVREHGILQYMHTKNYKQEAVCILKLQ